MDPFVQIVVLNWNGSVETLRSVASLEHQTYTNFRILVVDNGSTDDSIQKLSSLDGKTQFIALRENLGYTGGNNHAMQLAFNNGADYAWLFNSDAETEPDTLAKLVAACEANPKIGLASPLVLEEGKPDVIQFGCGVFDLSVPTYTPSYDIEQTVQWMRRFPDRIVVHGTALLVRRSLYDTIGGLDDRFFAYWEDMDYSIRSSLAGFHNVTVTNAIISHGSKATREAPETIKPHYFYFYSRNELLLWRKYSSGLKLLKAAIWILHRQLLQIMRMRHYREGTDAVLAGLWHGITGSTGRYDPERRVPWLFRTMLGRYPKICLRLLGG